MGQRRLRPRLTVAVISGHSGGRCDSRLQPFKCHAVSLSQARQSGAGLGWAGLGQSPWHDSTMVAGTKELYYPGRDSSGGPGWRD
ncbi:hypothetical protein RRG08_055904 [Elysia crispata]|uniref:Uncharacterized protein n=1 Tax=Elysia crispata TaxID=231223 RepID=A0AAE1CSD8_9GAST|nr:hypothetical protein RRG08_055904 [Elysia crispata]